MSAVKDLRVTVVQTELIWEDVAANVDSLAKKLSAVKAGATDVIVLPEMFGTGFTMNAVKVAETMKGKAVAWMRAMAAEKECCIAGSLVIKEESRNYNRLIWMRPDGSYDTYDKRHLFRMGEEQHTYSAGNKLLIVTLNGWKICPLVCYDLRFPVWSRNADNRYDCLIYVANWPNKRSYAWRQLLIARAIENLSYVVGVNRIGADGNGIEHSGDTAVTDAKGEIISMTKSGEESVETVVLSWNALQEYRKNFPAAMDADKFRLIN